MLLDQPLHFQEGRQEVPFVTLRVDLVRQRLIVIEGLQKGTRTLRESNQQFVSKSVAPSLHLSGESPRRQFHGPAKAPGAWGEVFVSELGILRGLKPMPSWSVDGLECSPGEQDQHRERERPETLGHTSIGAGTGCTATGPGGFFLGGMMLLAHLRRRQ